MDLHGAFHVYDTTLRDGAQQEGLNLSVADKLTIARQLDGLGVGYIEGGWPGANPKDTEFFRRAADELDLQHAKLAAFGATRRAGVAAADDPLVAALRDSGAPVVTLVAKSHDRHVELALRTTLEENLAMVRDTVTPPAGRGAAGVPRRRALLRRLPRQPRLRARGAAHGVRRRAPRSSRSATPTAGCCRAGSPTWSTTSSRRPASGSASTATTTPAARSRTPSPRSTPARRHVQGTHQRLRRAHRQRRPGRRRRQPRAQAGPAGAAAGAARRRDPDRARRRRGHQLPAGLAAAVRRRLGVHAQGRPARQRDQGRPGPLPAHRPGAASATTCGCWSPTWPAAPRSSSRAASSASTSPATGSWSPRSPTGSRSSSRAATRSRPPTRRSSCCSSRRWRASGRRTSRSSPGG